MVGKNMRQNTMYYFRSVYVHKHAREVADMLMRGVETPEQFDRLEYLMDSLHSLFPGVLGSYRRKNLYDIWVEVNAISKHALRSYPVAAGSGTSESLKILYGISGPVSESVLRKLLVHLFHRVRRSSAFRAEKDSLASIALTLCGWYRSK